MADLQEKRANLHQQIEGEDSQKMNELKRQLWVVNGSINHKLDEKLLSEIASKHEKINTVPAGYF